MKGFIRTASYTRVSSQRQADERTIDSQLNDIRARGQRDASPVDREFEYIDDGFSGSELFRPALERLRDHIAASLIDRLYVHSPDRLARNFAHQAILLEEMKKSGCEVVFLNQEGLPDSPETQMLIQMQGMFAEYERAKILERTRRGRRHAATKGKVSVFSRAPYGYTYFRKCETSDARWEIDPTESATVELMYDLVSQQGASLAAVCRELQARKILTKTGKVRWDPATVRGILLNPAYYGQARYGKERLAPRKPGRRANRGSPAVPRQAKVAVATPLDEQVVIAVPAIVSKSIFDEVRKRMDENRRRQRERRTGTKNLLSGLLICGKCGSAYCYYGGTKHHYCRCIRTDAHRHSAATLCTNTSVRSAELESFVWLDLCDLLADPKRIESEFSRRTAKSTNTDDSQEKQLQVVKNLQARLTRLIDAYTEGLIQPSEFESRIGSLRAQLDREAATLASLQGEHATNSDPSAISAALAALAETVNKNLATATFDLKRNLLKLLVQRIEICEEEIRIVYKVPPNPFHQSLDNRGNLQHWLSLQVAALQSRSTCKTRQ